MSHKRSAQLTGIAFVVMGMLVMLLSLPVSASPVVPTGTSTTVTQTEVLTVFQSGGTTTITVTQVQILNPRTTTTTLGTTSSTTTASATGILAVFGATPSETLQWGNPLAGVPIYANGQKVGYTGSNGWLNVSYPVGTYVLTSGGVSGYSPQGGYQDGYSVGVATGKTVTAFFTYRTCASVSGTPIACLVSIMVSPSSESLPAGTNNLPAGYGQPGCGQTCPFTEFYFNAVFTDTSGNTFHPNYLIESGTGAACIDSYCLIWKDSGFGANTWNVNVGGQYGSTANSVSVTVTGTYPSSALSVLGGSSTVASYSWFGFGIALTIVGLYMGFVRTGRPRLV